MFVDALMLYAMIITFGGVVVQILLITCLHIFSSLFLFYEPSDFRTGYLKPGM